MDVHTLKIQIIKSAALLNKCADEDVLQLNGSRGCAAEGASSHVEMAHKILSEAGHDLGQSRAARINNTSTTNSSKMVRSVEELSCANAVDNSHSSPGAQDLRSALEPDKRVSQDLDLRQTPPLSEIDLRTGKSHSYEESGYMEIPRGRRCSKEFTPWRNLNTVGRDRSPGPPGNTLNANQYFCKEVSSCSVPHLGLTANDHSQRMEICYRNSHCERPPRSSDRHEVSGVNIPSRFDSLRLLYNEYDNSFTDPSSDESDLSSATDVDEEKPELPFGHPFLTVRSEVLGAAVQDYDSLGCSESCGPGKRLLEDTGQDCSTAPYRKRLRIKEPDNSRTSLEPRSLRSGTKMMAEERPGSSALPLACPFFIKQPQQYNNCLKRGPLECIRAVKAHLLNNHMHPYYCPICYETFELIRNRDSHIVSRLCQPTGGAKPIWEGILPNQTVQLEKHSLSRYSEAVQWYKIWDIIFPGARQPVSPYLNWKIAGPLLSMRAFWNSKGQEIVGGLLASRGMLVWSLPNEERDLMSFYFLILSDLIDKVVRGLIDDSILVPDCEKSSITREKRAGGPKCPPPIQPRDPPKKTSTSDASISQPLVI
ncbi:hypothetical protein BJ170DRAFT_682969 [Xylariales sp. AK1849]|nr:hypothetical protein BJ170DRAFT_682969 [Xylariales sp. AK1849]